MKRYDKIRNVLAKIGKDEVTGSSPVSSSSRGVPLHPYHAFLLRGVIFLFPLRKHVKETTLITCRDGHFPPRLFLRKKRGTAPKLCALTARMVVGANSVRPFVHQTNLYYLHNICMLCKPFSASFLHDKKHRPNSSDGVIFLSRITDLYTP